MPLAGSWVKYKMAKTPALRRTVAVYLNKVVVTLVDRCNPSQFDKGTFFQINNFCN